MTDQYNYKLFEVLDHDKLIYICIVIGFCSCDQSTHQVVCILKEEPLKQKHHSQQHWHEGSIDGIWGNGLQGGKAQSLQSGAALVDGSKVIKQNLSPTKTSSPRASSLAWLISDSFFLVPSSNRVEAWHSQWFSAWCPNSSSVCCGGRHQWLVTKNTHGTSVLNCFFFFP